MAKLESLIIDAAILIFVILILVISCEHVHRCYQYPKYMALGIISVYLFYFITTALSIAKQIVNKKIDYLDLIFIVCYTIVLFSYDVTLAHNAIYIIVLSGLHFIVRTVLFVHQIRSRKKITSN
jgi:hypothetical protein